MNPPVAIELLHSALIAPQVRKLVFRRQDGEAFHYRAGEFVSLLFPAPSADEPAFRRSYSIANLDASKGQSETLELVASYVENGRASRWFWQAKTGDTLGMSGPNGQLWFPETPPKRVLLVGTGTGIAPYRAMLGCMPDALGAGVDVQLLFGVRQRDDAFYLDDFRAQANAHRGFHFTLCLSREAANAPDEFNGRVSNKLDTLAPDPETDIVYLCGNPQMVDEAYEQLKAKGFTFRNVKREKYAFSRS